MLRVAFIIFFFITFRATAQQVNKKVIDSLSKLDFSVLNDSINKDIYSDLTLNYVKAYVKKAKKTRDTTNIIIGYYYESLKKPNSYVLLDSIVYLSEKINNYNFITVGYYDKAINYYNERNFKKALDNYLAAYNNNKGSNKEYLNFLIENGIASLKSRIDHDDEALTLFKKNLEYVVKHNFKEEYPDQYFDVLSSLSHSFRKNEQLDSAYHYNTKGQIESQKVNRYNDYNHFLLNGALISFFKKEYSIAEDSINKALPFVEKQNDLSNLAVAHFYLGKIEILNGKKSQAINHFKAVDSIFTLNKDLLPELKENYLILKDYYKEKGDLKNELFYLERLIILDSVLNTNYKFISRKIAKKYDNNNLKKERERLTAVVGQKSKTSKTLIIAIIVIILGSLLYIAYLNRRNRKRLKRILEKTVPEIRNKEENIKPKINDQANRVNIRPEIIDDLLEKLQDFENNKGFVDSSINLSTLANKLETNPKYLSKVVNHYKEKNFSNYLNDLKINYAIEKLKADKQFRLYTIKAIAIDVGFNSAESFSKAFFNVTKLKPSYFLKELNDYDV
ncbi:helix-turn-helix transcriptional regulator [Flavobacteriaceae bacterium MHTCC 0001]